MADGEKSGICSKGGLSKIQKGVGEGKGYGTFWPKANGDVGMLLEDMVIRPQVVYKFSHAFRHSGVDATHLERSLNSFS